MKYPNKNNFIDRLQQEARASRHKRGFTLIELLVSVSIFVIVVFVAVGALLNLASVNDKSQTFLIAFENLDFALENMSRTIRDGSFYTCDVNGSIDAPLPLSSGSDCSSGDGFHFVDAKNNRVMYRLKEDDWDDNPSTDPTGAITRRRQPPSGPPQDEIPITSNEVDINELSFIVTGSKPENSPPPGDVTHMQPRVLMLLSGTTVLKGVKPEEQADFNVQTTMTQRKDNRIWYPNLP